MDGVPNPSGNLISTERMVAVEEPSLVTVYV